MRRVAITLFILAQTSTMCYSQNVLVESNNEFSFKLYNALKPDSSNFFISPFGLYIALSIANEGAGSETRLAMDRLLSIRGESNRGELFDKLIVSTGNLRDSTYSYCTRWNNDTATSNKLNISNSLWINDDVQINDHYKEVVSQQYHAELFQFNSANLKEANERLNGWIAEDTNDKIKDISGVTADSKLNIVDVIYFIGVWDVAFDEKRTKQKKFYTIDKEKVKIKYMQERSHFKYYEDDELQGIFLPYKCDKFSMVVILPKERYGLLAIENKFSPDYLQNIKKLSNGEEVILSLPKFKIESEISPKEQISKMGYSHMFTDEADFSGISSSTSLKIGSITHKTFIEVNEKTTEAAAMSLVEMIVTGYAGGDPPPPPPPKVFNADHPFLFLILDNRANTILFTGRFVTE